MNLFSIIMRSALLALAAGLALVSPLIGQAQAADLVSFESSNFPGRYIRHSNGLGVLDKIGEADALAKKDASFKMIPGLSGGGSWSLESVNFPGNFLRHKDGRVILSKKEGHPGFSDDASFRQVGALNGKAGISLESVNYPGYFIRHRNNEIWREQSDQSDLFKADATFLMFEAWAK